MMTSRYRQLNMFMVIIILLLSLLKCNGDDIEVKVQHSFKTKHSLHSAQKKVEGDNNELENIGNHAKLPMIGSDQVSSAAVKQRPIKEQINKSENEKENTAASVVDKLTELDNKR